MRLPSFRSVSDNAFASLKRFPLALVFAFIGTGITIYMVNLDKEDNALMQLLFTCFIGLPCMTGCHLLVERMNSTVKKAAVLIAGVAFVAIYGFFFAPTSSFDHEVEVITFFVLFICVHLWVAVAAFLTDNDRYSFWRFNNILFIRIVTAVIFSGVLFGGLALAILSIDNLFNVAIKEENYLKLFFFIAGIFNTWFFLSGIPDDFEELKRVQPFPKALKVFSQYILIPLSIVYLAILYAYGAKIVAQWNLPRGWVSALIMFYSIVGILAILLVYPLREKTEHSWVRLFARFFFIAILPLIVLLYVAVYTRVNEYGVTEPRYYLIVLGIWLTIIALYYIFSAKKNIKLIPISLLLLGLLSLFGPWNAFKISENSQVKRLKRVFNKYNMLSAEGINKPDKKLIEYDADQIRGVIYYLVDHRSSKSLSELYNVNTSALTTDTGDRNSMWDIRSTYIDSFISLSYIEDDKHTSVYKRSTLYAEAVEGSFNIAGYSEMYYIESRYSPDNDYKKKITLTDNSTLQLIFSKNSIRIEKGGKTLSTISMEELSDRLINKTEFTQLPYEELTIEGTGDYKTKLIIKHINMHKADKRIFYLNGYLLLE